MAYTTTKKVWQQLNKFTTVTSESLGTGDDTETEFSVDNNYVINGTYAIYIDGVLQIETTDYTINLNTGVVTFLVAPASGKAITADYWYAEIADAVVEDWISVVQEQMDDELNTSFESTSITNSYYDYKKERSFYKIKLWKKPIISIDSLEINEAEASDTADWKTLTEGYGEDFLVDTDNGVIIILDEDLGYDDYQNVRVSLTYGYSSVPLLAERLATLLAAKMTIGSKLMGEDFSSQNSIRIAEISISKASGDVIQTVNKMQEEIDMLYKLLGKGYEADMI